MSQNNILQAEKGNLDKLVKRGGCSESLRDSALLAAEHSNNPKYMISFMAGMANVDPKDVNLPCVIKKLAERHERSICAGRWFGGDRSRDGLVSLMKRSGDGARRTPNGKRNAGQHVANEKKCITS